jgi:hypothetical protein
MEPTDQVIAELRDLAVARPDISDRLLSIVQFITTHVADDARRKWDAMGLIAVCAECGARVETFDRCDRCHPPFDPVPFDGLILQ